MSWLKFNRAEGEISLYAGKYEAKSTAKAVGSWIAHNNAASNSNGSWPDGFWKWAYYKAHEEAGLAPACHPSAYGCFGIQVFSVPGRPGIGVHAGRTQGGPAELGGKTMGCIRVTVPAMEKINSVQNSDPLVGILVA